MRRESGTSRRGKPTTEGKIGRRDRVSQTDTTLEGQIGAEEGVNLLRGKRDGGNPREVCEEGFEEELGLGVREGREDEEGSRGRMASEGTKKISSRRRRASRE